ncbi:NUDIX hydrolase [Deinococcus maricopensis]|uniref:NUDIX hydrolase n=1 Tax=Deinococcus maricopensis (strain DSM 21211 / LMG 22137 / NRRL B-23946 / LB-34) TaxID=709986 RepID=E8U9L0_DEIML|nr:NUDIX domain-containing protein [Deinococcus maricopensis]ADV67749.1 NUDIX hydrolase [Deinococcus maricopensis DSM 21211]
MSARERYLSPSTVFILLRRDDQALVLQRVRTGWMDGHYSLPAGAVEAGETLRAAAAREAREEVGVRVDPHALRLVHVLHCRTQGGAWTGHFFEATTWEGTPALGEPHKHGHLHWAPLEALPEPFVPYVRDALLGAARGETYSESGWAPEVPAAHLPVGAATLD